MRLGFGHGRGHEHPGQEQNGDHIIKPRKRGLSRRGVLIGAGLGLTLSGVAVKEIPDLVDYIKLRIEFDGVWDELQAFLHAPNENELLPQAYKGQERISLTVEELQSLSIYIFGDSMNLKNGRRTNSTGENQAGSWGTQLAETINISANRLHIDTNVVSKNFAQPGTAGKGLVGDEKPEDNVQLGATKPHPPDFIVPPIDQLRNDTGKPIVALGMNGNDWRESVEKALEYLKDPEFKQFVTHPSKGNLTEGVVAKLKDLLSTYKSNRESFEDNFAQALTILAKVNKERTDSGKQSITLICTLPFSFLNVAHLPYAPLNSGPGHEGFIDLSQIPDAGKAAYRVTTSLYETINPLAEQLAEKTGMQVYTQPLLGLEKQPENFYEDGHLNELGEAKVAARILSRLNLKMPDGSEINLATGENSTANQQSSQR